MKLNKAGLTGFMMCFAAIIFGIATNGGIKTIVNFLHIPSFIVTVAVAPHEDQNNEEQPEENSAENADSLQAENNTTNQADTE